MRIEEGNTKGNEARLKGDTNDSIYETQAINDDSMLPTSPLLSNRSNLDTRNNVMNEDDLVLKVTLTKKDIGIAAGQFAAFYQGDVCLGTGVIMDLEPGEL